MPDSRKLRFVTAASLFDGHDAAINIMRRVMQQNGVEVIHLGHNRSVQEIVKAAIEEDADGIAISSYQGGHTEYFKFMVDLLAENKCEHIKVFGGGGGTITDAELTELHTYGVEKIYSVEDGRIMGLVGMIQNMIERTNTSPKTIPDDVNQAAASGETYLLAQSISAIENSQGKVSFDYSGSPTPTIGITGTGGAGKSSLTDEIVRRYLSTYPQRTIGILSVDPSSRRTGGALLGDRIRMNAVNDERVFMRSMATRRANLATSESVSDSLNAMRTFGFDCIILETAGIGQSDSAITDLCDFSLYVMTPEFGAPTQLEKIDMLDFADGIVLNKADKRGALDAKREVAKTYQRNHNLFETDLDEMPVFLCSASRFGDDGVDKLFNWLMPRMSQFSNQNWQLQELQDGRRDIPTVIPGDRVRYLSEIAAAVRGHKRRSISESEIACRAQALARTLAELGDDVPDINSEYSADQLLDNTLADGVLILRQRYQELLREINPQTRECLANWPQIRAQYQRDEFTYQVRGRDITVPAAQTTLSGLRVPKVALPKTNNWDDLVVWFAHENLPGEFPYTSGVFPFKRTGEDPTRMFAGEGTAERTNRRFHYVSRGQSSARLSTAFDSVTLYGEDPNSRPDIYGKVGNSGVSICSLDDAKRLYSGFDLCAPSTSVSMTINGPAPMMLAFFLNTAIDQQVERRLKETNRWDAAQRKISELCGGTQPQYRGDLPDGHDGFGLGLLGVTGDQLLDADEYRELKDATLQAVRGTVQADILKEDQAQNTCIFSTEFALKVMGDIQQYFVDEKVRNFYSVSISGYHIAEAGANPISQLAFTLANGFTFVEYYRARGMDVDSFAPNLSFFFSNGIDAEYSVIGRVARRIWSIALRDCYSASERSQKLKYHIQTSGRSLHAQEIDFNDIRTTLQALYAIYDNCQSLHTNAYDEAITTPTEESVRRALAIQMIINKELGQAKNENPLQGSFIIEELTELVEEAVLSEFERLSDRGGVLGAMETMYQRGKIQEESMLYESQKHSGELPIVGVNMFQNPNATEGEVVSVELIRSSDEEKQSQVQQVNDIHSRCGESAEASLRRLRKVALDKDNVFAELMECVKHCTLGQISNELYRVGGQYRRSM
ncbi:MAG: cobalamin B12-binding domain-containing protein [Planctomycetes bacterium]|nr:cobalamin B12-binding domain-containing protein [Planctomycetota bacterium]